MTPSPLSVVLLICLLILQGATGFYFSLTGGYGANAYAYHIGIPATLFAAAQVLVGVGLIRRHPVARWLALGVCLMMIIAAVLGPFLLYRYTQYVFVLGLLLGGIGKNFDGVFANLAFLLGSMVIIVGACGLLGYRALRYLRSFEGRAEFMPVDPEGGFLKDESFAVVIISAVIWIAAAYISSKEINVMRSSLPRFLMTTEMKKAEDVERARDLIGVTKVAIFTADSKRVIVAPSNLSQEYLSLDLGSGKLTHTGVNQTRASLQDYLTLIAPDGSTLINYGTRISLSDGDETRLTALTQVELLGFHTPTRFLAYDHDHQALDLVDIAADRRIYSVPLRRDQRGEPSGRAGNQWTRFSQVWSPDREHFAWLYRDGNIAVLTLATGTVSEERCPQCMYGGSLSFSADGRLVFVPDPVTRSQEDPAPYVGRVFDFARPESMPAIYRGDPQYFAGASGHALFWDYQAKALFHQDLPFGSRVWKMQVPASIGHVLVLGDGVVVTGAHDLLVGTLTHPENSVDMQLKSLPRVLLEARFVNVSADGRFALFVAGAKIEIVDLRAAMRGDPASRTLDLMDDDRLSVVTRGTSKPESVAMRWVEEETREAEPDPALVDSDEIQRAFEAARAARAAAGASVAGQEPESGSREAAESSSIHKCIDAAGSITFTQTLCPAGTRPVDVPTLDRMPSYPNLYAPKRSQRESPAPIPPALQGRLRGGEKFLSATKERVQCPGNPYSIRKPDRTFERYSVEVMITANTILRANGQTDVVYQDEFLHSELMSSRSQAITSSCNAFVEQRTKAVQEGRL